MGGVRRVDLSGLYDLYIICKENVGFYERVNFYDVLKFSKNMYLLFLDRKLLNLCK